MSHIEKKEFEIYRITPPPPESNLQEYIRQYVQTGDAKYFYWFLHYYEPTLNEKAKSFRNKYSMEEHFADIKQSLVTGLCKALVNYDISIAPFLPYAQRYMERSGTVPKEYNIFFNSFDLNIDSITSQAFFPEYFLITGILFVT